jgi:hypothetical protein
MKEICAAIYYLFWAEMAMGLKPQVIVFSQEMFLLLDRGSQFAFGGLLCLKYCPVVITAAHSNGVPSRHSNSARDTRHTTQNGGNGSGKAIHFQDFSSTTIP